jgi:diaminopimelate decarboxylase
VAPDAATESIRIVGDDGVGKFGMDDADARACAATASRSKWLELLGVHAFGASNVRDAMALVAHARATIEFGRTITAELGLRARLIDVGGGLGIPYRDDEAPLDLADLGRRLVELGGELAADQLLSETGVLIEPGRFLVGPAGVYVTRVLDRKTVRGRQIAIVDGGINHLIRPALVGQEHRLVRVGDGAPDDRSRVTIAGPLCSGLDILARDAPLGFPAVGESIVIRDVGAYGFTESMPLFLSHPAPAELVLSDGRIAAFPADDPAGAPRDGILTPATC